MLRYFVGRQRAGDNQTATDDCIVEIEWSDLPHNHSQALLTVTSLVTKKLLAKVSDGHHTPTHAGIKLIADANEKKLWQAAPPPSVTNAHVEHIDPVIKAYKKKPAAKKAAKTPAKAKPKAKKPAPKPKPKAKGVIRIKARK